MKQFSYRDRDYKFGQEILRLRTIIGLTQSALADVLGVSHRAVVAWETGVNYPNESHLKKLLELAVKNDAFGAGQEAEGIRELWSIGQQKVLVDEGWVIELLRSKINEEPTQISIPPFLRLEEESETKRPPHFHKLPFQPTQFIGRDRDLTELANILADPTCRLVTIIGPG